MGTLTDFSFLNEGETNTSKSAIGQRGANLDYRKSQAELREYTKMKELEKNQAALTRIQTLDFQDVLRRYYKNRPQILEDGTMLENKDFDGMSSTELLHYFYNDRTWRNNNTIALSRDVYDLGTGDSQDLQDWAIINQTFIDLPNFWNDPNRTFYQWAKDFIPAVIADPINLVGVGVGGVATREAIKAGVKTGIKEGIKTVSKKELAKLALKKGAIKGAKYEAVIGSGAAMGFDALQQSNEATAGLATEWNWKRTMLAGGVGMVTGGTLGAGFGAFGSKRAMGKYLKTIDGQVVDVAVLGKTLDGKQVMASKIDDGFIKNKNNVVKKVKGKKDKNIKKSKTVEVLPSESSYIIKQTGKINREVDEFFNANTVKGKSTIASLRKVFTEILKKKDTKNFRLERRDIKVVLDNIEKRAKLKLSDKTKKQILDEAEIFNQIGTEQGVNSVALRILQAKEVNRLTQLQEIFDGATLKKDKELAEKEVNKAWNSYVEVSSKLDKMRTNASDNLQAYKIKVDVSQAKQLKARYITVVKKLLADYEVNGVGIDKRREIKRNLLRNLNNENRMAKIVAKADLSTVEGRATFGDWLNEYTTANLLFDATTHMINILSGMVKYQWFIAQGYTRSVIMMPKHRKMALQNARLATDLFVGQFQFFRMALRKARRSFEQGRALGDQIQHKFDTKRWRAMDAYSKQLENEIHVSKTITKPMSWLGKAVYNSYRLLGAGDTFMKQAFNRAARAAHVNHRMRVSRPDLWAGKKGLTPKVNAVKEDQVVKHLDELIRWEKAKDKPNVKRIKKYEDRKIKLNELIKEKDKDEFNRVWKEWFNQYEDEFGNFISTKEMSKEIVETFDDFTKSILFDPQYIARENTFTNPLTSDLVPDAKDFTGKSHGLAGEFVQMMNNHPLMKVLFGVHFMKVPVHLSRFAWQHTPFLNKFHFQFKAMLKSPDPIIRSHAQSIQATSLAIFGIATSLAFQGKLHSSLHPDPAKKDTIQITVGGEEKYIKYSRLFPLSIPFMVVAGISDILRELPDIWNDKEHTEANQKFGEIIGHIGLQTMAVMSNVFSSNLMTAEAFSKLDLLFDGTMGYSEASKSNWWDNFKRVWGKDIGKLFPAVTGFRWGNRELAEADAELHTVLDKIMAGTPFVWVNEYGIPYYSLQPKRDPLGNILKKLEGVGLFGITNIDTPIKASSTWSDSILKTPEGKHLFESMEIVYKKPLGIVRDDKFGFEFDMRNTPVKAYKNYNTGQMVTNGIILRNSKGEPMIDINTGKVRTFTEGIQTFLDLQMEVKSTMVIDGMTLADRLSEMFDNPQSDFQKSIRWKKDKTGVFVYDKSNAGGKNPEAARVLEIIRIYENAARDWVLYNAWSGDEKGSEPIFYEKELENAERTLRILNEYQKNSDERITRLNALMLGN